MRMGLSNTHASGGSRLAGESRFRHDAQNRRDEGYIHTKLNRTSLPRTHPGTRISPGKPLIDLDVSVTNRHELDRDAANDAASDEGTEVA